MITTTYKCDRCGHEQNTDGRDRDGVTYPVSHPGYKDQVRLRRKRIRRLYRISVGVNGIGGSQMFENPEALWCRNCVIESGLKPWSSEEAKAPEEPVTIEDLIRAIARDEVENP